MEHPAVAEAAVVSSPDPLRGEVVMLNSNGGNNMFKYIAIYSKVPLL